MKSLISADQLIAEGQPVHEASLLQPEDTTEAAGHKVEIKMAATTLQKQSTHCISAETENTMVLYVNLWRTLMQANWQEQSQLAYLPEKKMPSTAAKATRRSAKLSELQHTNIVFELLLQCLTGSCQSIHTVYL